MRRILKLSVSVALLTMIASGAPAQSVYLTEAKKNPFPRTVFIDEHGAALRYTAFYSGNTAPREDIKVTFSVDAAKVAAYNSQNGTSYKVPPEGSYTMSATSSIIPKGSVCAVPGQVTVTGKGHLKASVKYLLPVTVSVDGSAAGADARLSTVYYLLTAVPAPGNVAVRKIGTLPAGAGSAFVLGNRYLIAENDGELSRRPYTGGNLGKAAPVAAPANLKEMDVMVNFMDRYIIGLYRGSGDGQLICFPIDTDAKSVGATEKVVGTSGYNIFSEIFTHGPNLYCRKPGGEMMIYPLTQSLEWGTVRSLGSGWNHPVIFGYGNSLIAIDDKGTMWRYPILKDGQPGLPEKTGTGWNKYDRIVVAGDDLLCVDSDGAVWKMEFDEEGFLAL
jgi:hypothetical protein